MNLNPIRWVAEFMDSTFSFAPPFLRPWILLISVGVVFYIAGAEAGEESEDAFGQVLKGGSIVASTLSSLGEVLARGLLTLVLAIGGVLLNVGSSGLQAIKTGGSQLVEVEEPPIKIGPLLEVSGIKIQIIRLILGLLGIIGLATVANNIPFL